jgi:hypothetical protein
MVSKGTAEGDGAVRERMRAAFLAASAKPPPFPPCDHGYLNGQFTRLIVEVQGKLDRQVLPEAPWEFHLDVLKGRVIQRWATLPEEAELTRCLDIIRKLHMYPPAACMGYDFLKLALIAREAIDEAEQVADEAATYGFGLDEVFHALREDEEASSAP